MNIDWGFIFSVLTGVTAMIALVLTLVQIRLSNKQSLFDRRVKCYTIADGLINLYEQHKEILECNNNGEPIFSVGFVFGLFTNNAYLESIYEPIKQPLVEPGHTNFLIKCEELKQLALECELVFKGNPSKNISQFILSYENMLFKLYQYLIVLDNMRKYNKEIKASLEITQKAMNEPNQRKKLLDAYAEIKESYNLLDKNKSMKKLRKQIKLRFIL